MIFFVMTNFFRASLKGAAQVVFSAHALAGLLILLAVCYGAFQASQLAVGMGALVGLLVSTLTGKFLKLKTEEGLCGFNGVLIGIGIPTFLGSSSISWVLLVILSVLSVFVLKIKFKFPIFTTPFIVLTWLGLVLGRYSPTPVEVDNQLNLLNAFLKGFSQIFLINNSLSGALILLALLITSSSFAVWGILGAVLSISVSTLFLLDNQLISSGLLSYNSILTALALGAVFKKSHFKVISGIIVAVGLQVGMAYVFQHIPLPTLTAPFVISTLLFLF